MKINLLNTGLQKRAVLGWAGAALILLQSLSISGLPGMPQASAFNVGTVRQEINLIDTTYTATNAAMTSDEFSQLDPSKYSGTVAYYFEVVGTATAGSTGNVTLRRHGTTTDDATIALSNLGTSATRYRSGAFTAPGSATEYSVYADAGGSGKTVTIKAARLIIIQTSSPMTAAETQVEIGSKVLAQTNTAITALPNTKYWTYKASAWDNSPTFYAEATFKTLNTSVTVWLQEDDGSFGSWSNKISIGGGDEPTPIRSRTAFTPTDGRHYRVATIMSGSVGTYNYDVYNAKIVIDQTGTSMDPISKLQPQFLLINNVDSNATGTQGYQTLYSANEWSGSEVFKAAFDSDNASNSAKFSDISNSNADVAKSTLTGANQQIGPNAQYVQSANNASGATAGTTQSATFGSNVTAGDLIVVAAGAFSTSYTPTISDNQGNTYSLVRTASGAGVGYQISVYYAVAKSTGSLTVTHGTSISLQYRRLAIHEYRDLDSYDTSAGNSSASGAPNSGNFTTTHDDGIIFGWGVSNNGIASAGAGFTAREAVGAEMTEDKIAAAQGTYSAAFPVDGSAWVAIGAGFYKSGGISLSFTDNHEIDTNVTNTTGNITATRIIVDESLPTSVVSVSVSDGNISYGLLATGSSKDTTSSGLNDTQTATNDGNIAEDFNIKGQNTANWTLAGTTGANQYKHEFCTSGSGSPDPCDSAPTWTALTTSYQTLASNISASSTKKFDLKLNMPTSTANYSQQSVDITIQAVQH